MFQSESSFSEDSDQADNDTNGKSAALLQQKQDAQEMLDRITALKNVILVEAPFPDDSTESLESYQRQVDQLENQVTKMETTDFVPPTGLTLEEYKAAMALFLQMPYSVRCAFCLSLELEQPGKAATDLQRIPEIVTLLYEQRIQLTPQRLQDARKQVQNQIMKMSPSSSASSATAASGTSSTAGDTISAGSSTSQQSTDSGGSFPQKLSELFGDDDGGKTNEELRLESTVKNVLGRVTRKDDIEATQQDLDRVLKALDRETFAVASTTKIPGGFVIRGQNKKKTGPALIAAIDAKLPNDFPSQVSFMDDVTSTDTIGENSDPVLVLLNKDFSPRISGILTGLSSLLALLSAFIFCVSTYGMNDIVGQQLSEATAVNDATGINLFTNRVYDVLLPLLCVQVWHELAHFAVAKLNKMEMGFPILLPFLNLPFMGAKTDLTSSPPNRRALLDFALAGPLVGILGSVAFLVYGLQLTATADASTLQYFPSLPVSLLKTSTLGGSIVDYFLGGGLVGAENRFITMQDPATPVVMHPLAVAGFCALIINSIAMLPLGSADGGRASLAIFGRYGNALVGGAVWLSLLVASFTIARADILIAVWLVNNIVQNDMEIPCRDETEEVDIPRFSAALALWIVTALAIIPLS